MSVFLLLQGTRSWTAWPNLSLIQILLLFIFSSMAYLKAKVRSLPEEDVNIQSIIFYNWPTWVTYEEGWVLRTITALWLVCKTQGQSICFKTMHAFSKCRGTQSWLRASSDSWSLPKIWLIDSHKTCMKRHFSLCSETPVLVTSFLFLALCGHFPASLQSRT